MVSNELRATVSPDLFPFVESVTLQGKLGVCQRNPGILDIKSSCVTTETPPTGDRFKVSIPYAGLHLQWEVLFNHAHPEIPPDFIFGSNETAFVPEIEHVKSLENWDPDSNNALIDVLQELLSEFKKYQLSLVQEHSRWQYEYSEIIGYSDGFRFVPDDIEVHVTKKNQVFDKVNFLLKLPIDFSKIPPYLTLDHPGELSALLLLSMENPEKGAVRPQLFLSPSAKHVLGDSESVAIPPFPTGGLLIDYIPRVCELLANKVKQISNGFELRKDYIVCFLRHLESCVLEYDAEKYRKISFLMEWHDFFFIITNNFPNEQPAFLWQSVYHEGLENKPYFNVDKTYPYSPRWKAPEMVDRARTHILEKVSEFQKKSVTEGKLHVN